MSFTGVFVWRGGAHGPAVIGALLLFLLATAGGCGGGGGPEKPTAASMTGEGWTAFEKGSYETASARFADALALDSDYADAFVGQGWVAVRLREFAVAQDRFDEALLRDAEVIDALAGEVLVSVGQSDPGAVRSRGALVLTRNVGYVFPHDRAFSASDVRWFMARAALDMADYAAVVVQLDVLSPGHGLDPGTATFVERAVALLESLRATV